MKKTISRLLAPFSFIPAVKNFRIAHDDLYKTAIHAIQLEKIHTSIVKETAHLGVQIVIKARIDDTDTYEVLVFVDYSPECIIEEHLYVNSDNEIDPDFYTAEKIIQKINTKRFEHEVYHSQKRMFDYLHDQYPGVLADIELQGLAPPLRKP